MTKILNLFAELPDASCGERFDPLFQRNGLLVERIVSQGQVTPDAEWYDQSWDEWILLLAGSAEIVIEGDEYPTQLVPGDSMLFPARCRHRVTGTAPDSKTVWLAVHYGDLPYTENER